MKPPPRLFLTERGGMGVVSPPFRSWRFTVLLVCLWIDIDYIKFQPRSVSHCEAVRRAHRRHRLVLQTIFL